MRGEEIAAPGKGEVTRMRSSLVAGVAVGATDLPGNTTRAIAAAIMAIVMPMRRRAVRFIYPFYTQRRPFTKGSFDIPKRLDMLELVFIK